MKKILIVSLCFLLLCSCGEKKKEKEQKKYTQADAKTVEVYITKTGEKYHTEDCNYLKSSCIETTLAEAIEKNYSDCSVCKPPLIKD